MSNKVRAETIRGLIKEKEITLDNMRERARLLARYIPILERELEAEKARLAEIEKLIEAEKPVAGEDKL